MSGDNIPGISSYTVLDEASSCMPSDICPSIGR